MGREMVQVIPGLDQITGQGLVLVMAQEIVMISRLQRDQHQKAVAKNNDLLHKPLNPQTTLDFESRFFSPKKT